MTATRVRPSLRVACVLTMIMCVAVCARADVAADATRNAIFNGDFLEGRSGWSIGGPDDVVIETRTNMVAHRADAELSLRHDGLAETMTLFSQHPINVKPGREYTLALTAAGEGTIAFGVYEYDERAKNTVFPLSKPIALTAEPETHTFTYAASEQAGSIRPRIRIIGEAPPAAEPTSTDGQAGGSAGAFHVRLLNFELMLSQAEFLETTNWPEWAVSGELSKYRGLSPQEIREITRAVTVDGVLPPYEPIRVEGGGAFALTTSRFRFARSVFPSGISVLDTRVLADEMLFEVETDDGQSLAATTGRPSFAADGQQVVVRQTVEGEGGTLTLEGTLAYDGLMVFDLNLQADRPVRIRRRR